MKENRLNQELKPALDRRCCLLQMQSEMLCLVGPDHWLLSNHSVNRTKVEIPSTPDRKYHLNSKSKNRSKREITSKETQTFPTPLFQEQTIRLI